MSSPTSVPVRRHSPFAPGADTGARALSWRERALCQEPWVDPELFHPTNQRMPGRVKRAKKICDQCPVRAECLRWALDINEPNAIAGGTTPGERRRMRNLP